MHRNSVSARLAQTQRYLKTIEAALTEAKTRMETVESEWSALRQSCLVSLAVARARKAASDKATALAAEIERKRDSVCRSIEMLQEEADALTTRIDDIDRRLQKEEEGCVILPFPSRPR